MCPPPWSKWINGWFPPPPRLSSTEFFKSLLLSFSPNLDEFNPDIPEWRQDVGRVIKKALLQVSDFHFLCPVRSLLPILRNSSVSFYIRYFRSSADISPLFPSLLLPVHPNTLGSLVQQEGALRPTSDSSSDRSGTAPAFIFSQDGFLSCYLSVSDLTSEL